jgi:hypothetical protein
VIDRFIDCFFFSQSIIQKSIIEHTHGYLWVYQRTHSSRRDAQKGGISGCFKKLKTQTRP